MRSEYGAFDAADFYRALTIGPAKSA